MRYRYVLGLSSATILLFISMTGFDLPKIGGDATGALGSMAYSFNPVAVAKLGDAFYDWEVGRRKKETDRTVTEQMDRIFERLKEAALTDREYGAVAKEIHWKLNTLQDKTIVMAKAFPGGGIAVYDGVFPVAETEGALAAILVHEMAHLLARHEPKRLTGDVAAAVMTVGPAIAAGTSPAEMDPKIIGPVAGALGVGYTVGVRQPWRQAQEEEADCLGLLLAAKSGYDPIKIAGFWRRMENAGKTEGANERYQFLNDHPINEDRVAHIKNTCLPPAQKVYNQVESGMRQNALARLPGVMRLDKEDGTGILFPRPDERKQRPEGPE